MSLDAILHSGVKVTFYRPRFGGVQSLAIGRGMERLVVLYVLGLLQETLSALSQSGAITATSLSPALSRQTPSSSTITHCKSVQWHDLFNHIQ